MYYCYFFQFSKKAITNPEANTFGWVRAEVLGALINAVFLVALCLSIFIEAIKRMVQPEGIHNPMLVLIVGAAGLVVNLIGMLMFHGEIFHSAPCKVA